MIVYIATKQRFLEDSFTRDIHEIVNDAYTQATGGRAGQGDFRSWKDSLMFMAKALNDPGIPENAGVAVEYVINQSRKRIDFIMSGRNETKEPRVVVVELKQWSHAVRTQKDGIVRTRFGVGEQETPHPSYQAWSYAALLKGFNEAVYDGGIELRPCAYLHNYEPDDQIGHSDYRHYIELAPLFLKGDIERVRLRDFIKSQVRYGDDAKIIVEIENGRIRPSKALVDSLVKMIDGHPEFVLIDDQKVAFETALVAGKSASSIKKKVLIVEGGPGTGKSVIAINLLVAFSKLGLLSKYVTKNAAPRTVFESALSGVKRKTEISNMFSGSGAFVGTEPNIFDVLVVDEAHRLNEKGGLFGNLGENQVKELIDAAKATVFFIDEDQRVTFKDIGSKQEIARWASAVGAEVETIRLASQFRCNGSDGYLAWLDDVLGIRETANKELDLNEFDFRVLDSPNQVLELVKHHNHERNKARMVAGYCWNWVSKKDSTAYDVVIPEYGFRMKWNLASDGGLWMVAPTSVDEIGCIHTCQGLEVDYIGVIIGPDLIYRDDAVRADPKKRARSDKSLSGLGKIRAIDPTKADAIASSIIKNTYRTLLTRGMKGCFVYCTDAETAEYLRSRLKQRKAIGGSNQDPETESPRKVAESGPRYRSDE